MLKCWLKFLNEKACSVAFPKGPVAEHFHKPSHLTAFKNEIKFWVVVRWCWSGESILLYVSGEYFVVVVSYRIVGFFFFFLMLRSCDKYVKCWSQLQPMSLPSHCHSRCIEIRDFISLGESELGNLCFHITSLLMYTLSICHSGHSGLVPR